MVIGRHALVAGSVELGGGRVNSPGGQRELETLHPLTKP